MRKWPLVALACLAGLGCGEPEAESDTLRVFAASSLRDVLPAIDDDVDYQFAGSDELARQIEHGARADVLISANEDLAQRLRRSGSLAELRPLAGNRLVVVAAPESDIRRLTDLDRPGIRLLVADPAVPAGALTERFLNQQSHARFASRIVSHERDVRAVLAKVALGEADAGFVYATDIRAAPDVRLVAETHLTTRYVGGLVAGSANQQLARTYLDQLADAESIWKEHGFRAP